MFEPLLDAVLVVGPLKEVYYCNDACVSLFDLSRKKIVSECPIYDWLTVDDSSLFISKEGTKGELEETGYIEVNFESKSGKKGLVQISILPTQELFGRNKLWFVYFHDVSLEDRLHRKYLKQLQEKEAIILSLDKSREKTDSSQNIESLFFSQLVECTNTLFLESNNLDIGLKNGKLGVVQVKATIEAIQGCAKKISKIIEGNNQKKL